MISRRMFLQTAAALSSPLLYAVTPESSGNAAENRGKRITLLPDGGFDLGAPGWQFTRGASVDATVARRTGGSLRVRSEAGDYARFFLCNPRSGASYTLSGWLRTDDVRALVPGGGAFYAAPQFEFQARPTEFTAEGHIAEQHLGNVVGTTPWTRFQQTVVCREGTTWLEVGLGLYRASGTVWFDDVTLVEGDAAVELEEAVEPHVAAAWAHQDVLAKSHRTRPRAAILRDTLPVRGAAADPARFASLLGESYETAYLTAAELANPDRFNRTQFDLLVLPYGESFPLPAQASLEAFLSHGGDLLTTGGYAFLSPLVQAAGGWIFDDQNVLNETAENLVPTGDFSLPLAELRKAGWTFSRADACTIDEAQKVARVSIPKGTWGRSDDWRIRIPAQGLAKRFAVEARVRAEDIDASQGGCGHFSLEQLDRNGFLVYATPDEVEAFTGTSDWTTVRRIVALAPDTRFLSVRFGLRDATGSLSVAAVRLEERSPEPRINTAKGFPQDQLVVESRQIGMFNPDYRLQRVAYLEPAPAQDILRAPRMDGAFSGYAACGVLAMNHARWIPLLNAYDRYGRLRGAAGALMHNYDGPYARGSWAFFGVDSADLFASGHLDEAVRSLGRALTRKLYLHEFATNFACYREGEAVRMRTSVSNYGREARSFSVEFSVAPEQGGEPVYRTRKEVGKLAAGARVPCEAEWKPGSFGAPHYHVEAVLSVDGQVVDRASTGFLVWKEETLKAGALVSFRDNYMRLQDRPMFLQGTDDYLYLALDRHENPNSWQADAYGCRDSCVDIYENLMGLRGPQQNPPEAWWRWIDGLLLAVQRAGGVFMPGMLIFSNTAVGEDDLAEQKLFCRRFAERYRGAPGLIYYLNGDLELHNPNLPELQQLYRTWLKEKYGSEEKLKEAWSVSPPAGPLSELPIRRGTENLLDVRSFDDYEFRAGLVSRWLGALSREIRQIDTTHPITAEFYQASDSGIDLRAASGDLDFANFGYFDRSERDRRRFAEILKFLDQSLKGKGAHVGEFGVKTHAGWQDATSYLQTRTERYEQDYFLEITHTAFGEGGTKVQNWSWRHPADLPFEWGITHQCDGVPRDVRAYYRNSGLLFRYFRPKFTSPSTVFVIPENVRKGGEGEVAYNGLLNSIRLLIDAGIQFSPLEDTLLAKLPETAKVIFYPLPFCPSDETVDRLEAFVRKGGRLYLSGDLTYDPLRRRTRADRLERLCGVTFVAERYPRLAFGNRMEPVRPAAGGKWPDYHGAPCIEVRPAGATVLASTATGVPVLLEHKLGNGVVLFNTDPFELHAPEANPDSKAVYRALIEHLGAERLRFEPEGAAVHPYRIATEDRESIYLAVNYGGVDVPHLRIPTSGRPVTFSLAPHKPGVVGVDAAGAVIAFEGQGEVRHGDELLLRSGLHLAAMAFDRQPLARSRSLMLLPMGTGNVELPAAKRWRNPVVIVGAVERGKWKTYERFRPEQKSGVYVIPIDADRDLGIVLVGEAGEESQLITRAEAQLLRPWATT